MTKLCRSLTAIMVAGLFLTACGRSQPNGTTIAAPSAPSDAQVLALGQAVAQCLRDHGVARFPDPQFDARGELTLPDAAVVDAAAEERAKSLLDGVCREQRDRLDAALQDRSGRHNPPSKPMSAEDLAKLRQYTECMREHGFPTWPDPDATGTYHLGGLGLPEGLGKLDRPIDATFHSALATCEPFAVPGMGIGA